MGKIKWSEKAAGHLQSIHEYISYDSKVYATRFIKSLIEAAKKLESMPFRGRYVPEFRGEFFREVIFKSYRIVYRVVGDEHDVEILAVVHGARDLRKAYQDEWEV